MICIYANNRVYKLVVTYYKFRNSNPDECKGDSRTEQGWLCKGYLQEDIEIRHDLQYQKPRKI